MQGPDITLMIQQVWHRNGVYHIVFKNRQNQKQSLGNWRFSAAQQDIFSYQQQLQKNDYQSGQRVVNVQDFGKQFFLSLPPKLQALLWQQRHGRKSLQILFDDQLWLPWEWLYLVKDGEEAGFIARCYSMAQWPLNAPPAAQSLSGEHAFRVEYEWQQRQGRPMLLRSNLTQRFRSLPIEQFRNGGFFNKPCDAWLLLVESFSQIEAGTFGFKFGSNDRYLPEDLQGQRLDKFGPQPLILFANCSSGQVQQDLFGVRGWPKAFITAGAGALVCAYFEKVNRSMTEFAAIVEDQFFQKGESLGMAVLKARLQTEDEADFPRTPLFGSTTATYGPPNVQPSIKDTLLSIPMQERFKAWLTPANVALTSALTLALLISVWLLGLSAHHYRTAFLGIKPLDYPAMATLKTGFVAFPSGLTCMLKALYPSHPYLLMLSWGSLSAMMGCYALARRNLAHWLCVAMILLAIPATMILYVGLDREHPRPKGVSTYHHQQNPMTIWASTTQTWLNNDSEEANHKREAFFGAYLWALSALLFVQYWTLNMHTSARLLLAGVISLFSVPLLLQSGKPFAFAYWGLNYPQVILSKQRPPDFSIGNTHDACCLFDVSEGASAQTLISVCGSTIDAWKLKESEARWLQRMTKERENIHTAACLK